MPDTDTYYADLHIHSKFSRATSKQLTPRHLAAWGWVKGIDLLATGDFTHPGWLELLEEQLEEDGHGLLRLKDPAGLGVELPWLETPIARAPRFMLGTEISSIYKRGGAVRKVHNLVYFPHFAAVHRFNERLEQVGNLQADGRPILGLDAEHLLEMVLETDPLGFVIPAHIWTPWFSLFGSKSGFNALQECFGALTEHIFAVETGLSSDPAMNWHWSALDHLSLVSNSDAHSGANLAREATIFRGPAEFETLREGLRDRKNGIFQGTLEFFPEEGKYHHDGHRKCGLSWDPRQTRAHDGICPVCGRPVTVGVLNRILELADRDQPRRPADHPDFVSLIPLPEILSELLGVGPKSKRVQTQFCRLLERFGPELPLLRHTPTEDIRAHWPTLAEAIHRMRLGQVQRQPGFDGHYGRIQVFTEAERREMHHGPSLLTQVPRPQTRPECAPETAEPRPPNPECTPGAETPRLNREQEAAVSAGPGPVVVQAGPGTGKTRTLLARVQRLLETGTPPEAVLLLTFTRATAQELRHRLQALGTAPVQAGTLHSLAYAAYTQHHDQEPIVLSEEDARNLFCSALGPEERPQARDLWAQCQLHRESGATANGHVPGEAAYRTAKAERGVVDYTDLLYDWRDRLHAAPQQRWEHILVDEIQDLTGLQLEIVQTLAVSQGNGFFGIGDPDQSIYAFRGAINDAAAKLRREWPEMQTLHLAQNYRSAQAIIQAARALFPDRPLRPGPSSPTGSIVRCSTPNAWREAAWIAEQVRRLLGATAHSQADGGDTGTTSPGDIAILVRSRVLLQPLAHSLDQAGLPCSVPEEEPFWRDSRIQNIVDTVRAALGRPVAPPWQCPQKVLEQGPAAMAAFWAQEGPVDPLFWNSKAFQALQRTFARLGDWERVLTWLARQDTLDTVRHRVEKVRIMTLHASKGLEFTAVFLPALEEGIVPFAGPGLSHDAARNDLTTNRVAEEKRLFYVGLTRAKEYLYLSHAQNRRLYGRTVHNQPSRFLHTLPAEVVHTKTVVAKKKQTTTQLKLM